MHRLADSKMVNSDQFATLLLEMLTREGLSRQEDESLFRSEFIPHRSPHRDLLDFHL